MCTNFRIKKSINVVMDCGNAVGGIIAPSIYKEVGINLNELYCDVDPTFPNHHPDPTVDSNLEDIIKIIKDGKYDLGVAFDGDADRIVVIDEQGEIIRPDILLALFLPEIINKNDSVVYDVKCSKALEDTIKSLNAKPIMWKTGHSLIKNKMIESKSKIGGEMSGHIFFADKYFGYDDGIYVGLRLIELLSNSNKKLSELVSKIPKYISTPEIRIECKSDEEKFQITKKVKEYFVNKYDCNTTDGVRINYSNGWGLIRSSNTQPVIVCRFESDSVENLEKIKKEIFFKLKEFGNIYVDNA
jgi:phosphomannomutase/phosphoglucomutase